MMRKIMMLFVVMAIVFGVSCNTGDDVLDSGSKNKDISLTPLEPSTIVYVGPWDGTSSEEITPNSDGVYKVSHPDHLAWLADQTVESMATIKKVKFIVNIDMDNKNFKGITNFSGSMDGNGKRIKNLKIETSGDAGLVLELGNGGEIKNLTIESGEIKSTSSEEVQVAVGTFVAQVAKNANVVFSGLTNKANVTSVGVHAGGVIGQANSASSTVINNVENMGTIKSSGYNNSAGGIIGISFGDSNTIINSINSGNVRIITSGGRAGGIIGQADANITKINKVENTGTIKAVGTVDIVGGIIGYVSSGVNIINNARNMGVIKSSSDNNSAGGIVGVVFSTTTIGNTYNYGEIIGTSKKVGIVGANKQGGIVGWYRSSPTTPITITDSFYLTSSAGNAVGGVITDEGAIKIDVAAFGSEGTFRGWDFSTIWQMGAGYPILK